MVKWDHTLRLQDIWKNTEIPFEAQRDAIVARIKASRFYEQDYWDLEDIVVELATSDSFEEFDEWWDSFYDWADSHSVWVAIH